MAEIPVERKSGNSLWWLWLLLALLIVGLLIWWAMDNGEEDDEALRDVDTMTVEQVQPGGVLEPLTDPAAAAGEPASNLDGRQVRLTNVTVQSVVSDAGFWLDAGQNQRVFAVLTEEMSPNQPGEGIARVNEGATIDLTGTIRTGTPDQQLAANGNTTIPQGVDRYIVVDNYRLTGATGAGTTANNTM